MTAFVYVIEADNGEVKVGLSGTPYARLSKIKREYGPRRGFVDARLVGFVRTRYALVVESLAQHRIEGSATGGEWYRLDPIQALVIVLQEAMFQEDGVFVQWPERPRAARGNSAPRTA